MLDSGLTALSVNPGTLSPIFHSQSLEYTVSDIANADNRITLAVAGFGMLRMLLRDSPYASAYTLEDTSIGLAERGQGYDPRGYRGEFFRLFEAVRICVC